LEKTKEKGFSLRKGGEKRLFNLSDVTPMGGKRARRDVENQRGTMGGTFST